MFRRDPVNLIRLFHLAQKHNLAFHPEAMRAATRSLKLIDAKVRGDKEANRLFLDILTSKSEAETVLRRMNEAGVLGEFVRAFGRIVAMMQFNMYHHYTVDEHLLRCIGVLNEIEQRRQSRGRAGERADADDPAASTARVLLVALFLHDIAKGRVEDHSIAGARIARRFCPRLGLNAAETELVAWLVEVHLVMSTVAQSRDLSDRKTIENFAAVVQSLERMKLLYHPDHRRHPRGRAGGVERMEGAAAAHALLRDRTGADRRLLRGQPRRARGAAKAEFRAEVGDWPAEALDAYIARHYPAYWLKVDLPHKVAQARFVRATESAGKRLATSVGFDAARGVTELTVYAPDHPWLLSIIAGACALAGANIVDAQIYTTTDGLALDTIARLARVRARRGRGAARRTHRRRHREGGARPDQAARGGGQARAAERAAQGFRHRARGDHQQSMVAPLHRRRGDRPRPPRAPLRADRRRSPSSTSTSPRRMSRPSANAWSTSSMSPTCSARRSRSPTRQAAIKRPLLALFTSPGAEGKPARERGGVSSFLRKPS